MIVKTLCQVSFSLLLIVLVIVQVAIIGPVGSGKSSIIQAVLGEFPSSQGSVTISGAISYSPQEAWVFSGTVRQNILFGMEFDQKRYWKVIEDI